MSDTKSNYPELKKIIESYILPIGIRIPIDDNSYWILYIEWRPQIDETLDSIEFICPNIIISQKILNIFKKYGVDKLYYMTYQKK